MSKKHSSIPKFLALVLAVMLLVGSFPVAALDAAEVPVSENDTQAIDETQAPDVDNDVDPDQPAADPEDAVEPVGEKPTEDLAPVGDDPDTDPDKGEGEEEPVPTEEPTEPPMNISDGYYLFGGKDYTAQDWQNINNVKPNEKFTDNPENDKEKMLYTNLESGRKIKVVEVKNNKIEKYYPDGLDNEFTVSKEEHTGNVVIFFRTEANNDWDEFGKHFYIAKKITKKNDQGQDEEVDIEEDTDPPTLTRKGYAYTSGSTKKEWDPENEWIDKNKKPYVLVEAKDDGFGVNTNSFSMKTKSEYVRPSVEKATTQDQYYLGLVDTDPTKITVKDNAGNTSDPIETQKLKIDYDKPSQDDIVSGVFSKPDGETIMDILRTLTFGAYTNETIIFTVSVKANGGSPIENIVVSDGTAKLTKQGKIVVEEKEGSDTVYKQSFKITPKDTPYDLKVTTISDHCYSNTMSVSILDMDLYADGTELADRNPDLYELVCTQIKPNSEIEITKGDKQNEIYTTADSAIEMKATLTDGVAGIYEEDGGVNVYFGLASELAAKDGAYTVADKYKVAHTVDSKERASLGAQTGKVTKEVIKATLPADIKTGEYRIVTVVENNSGNIGYQAFDLTVDNDVPVIEDVSVVKGNAKLTDWTKEPIQIRFKASDDSGNVELKATGSITGEEKTYSIEKKDDGYYYFTPDQQQDYTIVATDAFGHSMDWTVEAKDVLFDDDAPVISDVKYDSNSYSDSSWKKKVADGGGVTVSFNVTDLSEKCGNIWQSGGKDVITGTEDITVTVTGLDDHESYIATKDSFSETTGYSFSFVSDTYQQYEIVATDHAGNDSQAVKTEKTKVDYGKPEITNVSFRSESANPVLNFLTFGLYSDKQIIMTVETADKEVSSDIKEITATNVSEGIALVAKDGFKEHTYTEGGSATASKEFVINQMGSDETLIIQNAASIAISVTDNANYTTAGDIYNLQKDGKLTTDNGVTFDDEFEIAASNAEPTISDVVLTDADGKVDAYTDSDGKVWFPGDVAAAFSVAEPMTKIHSVSVTLNGSSITKYCDATINDETASEKLPAEYTNFENGAPSTKVKNLSVQLNTRDRDIAQYLKTTAHDKNGENKLVITVVSNNEKETTKEVLFYVDNTIPEITEFKFEDGDTESPDADVEKTTYGYYFKNYTTVVVSASDIGSGLKDIHFYGVAATTQYGTSDIDDTPKEFESTVRNGSKEFAVPANFKGQIYAYAYDNVVNRSRLYNPEGLIVENEGTHNLREVSGSEITINSSPVGTSVVGTDGNSVDLYNGDVSVSFEIWDMYSGLDEVSYRIVDTAHPDPAYTTVNAKNTGVGQAYVDDWRIASSESNLAYRLTTTITVSAQEHNDNYVRIQLKGTDRAGFEIPQIEKAISIDITNPVIELEYDPVLTAAQHHNGENYFNVDRTATITITERNFDPDQIDWSKFVAIEGSRPAVVGVSNWSTSYEISSANASGSEQRTAVHKATITFAEDGKFDVDFEYTDLAGNVGEKKFERETFYIDKTKPVMTVTLEKNSTPRYYQSNTATIRIVEHNFDPDSAHLTYTPTATGPDYASGGTAPQIGAWSNNGDEHTATIPFNDEGKYSFKISFRDLADNKADDHNEPEFYIDHTANKPEFKDVTSRAYDGEIAPGIVYQDHSFDTNNYKYTLTRHAYNIETRQQETSTVDYPANKQINSNSSTGLASGADVKYQNFDPNDEMVDGIYTLKAEFTDLANNHAEDSITFSVNRFGSVFILGSLATEELVENYYTNDAPDVVIREISAVPHSKYSATLSYNSSNKDLKEGSNLKVDTPNSVGAWYEYRYTVGKSNFENEGEYTVTVSSSYKYGSKESSVSNRTASVVGDHDRNCPVTFVVDKTAPKVVIAGVDENGYYSEAEKTLEIICTDDNLDTGSLEVEIDGQPYDVEAAMKENGEELFGEIDLDIPIVAANGESKHKITAQVKDYAKNENSDKIDEFTLSATFLTMFFHNTVALIITGAVLAALIALGVILFIKKRKNSAD